jgi:hypothetical protein
MRSVALLQVPSPTFTHIHTNTEREICEHLGASNGGGAHGNESCRRGFRRRQRRSTTTSGRSSTTTSGRSSNSRRRRRRRRRGRHCSLQQPPTKCMTTSGTWRRWRTKRGLQCFFLGPLPQPAVAAARILPFTSSHDGDEAEVDAEGEDEDEDEEEAEAEGEGELWSSLLPPTLPQGGSTGVQLIVCR